MMVFFEEGWGNFKFGKSFLKGESQTLNNFDTRVIKNKNYEVIQVLYKPSSNLQLFD